MILKLDRVAGERLDAAEYARQRAAVRTSPAFAERHLGRLAEPGHDLVRVGEGWWIVFQTIAGGSVDDLDVLTKWLASVRSGRPLAGGPLAVRARPACPAAKVSVLGLLPARHEILRTARSPGT